MLREGERKLTFELEFAPQNPVNLTPEDLKKIDLAKIFEVDFSGEKNWILGEVVTKDSNNNSSNKQVSSLEGQKLTLIVLLNPEQDPVVPYHSKLSGAALAVDNNPLNKPVARIHFKSQAQINELSAYSYFRDIKITEFTVTVDVSEVRDLILQNDLAVLDPSKPFQPFGPQPKIGANFYIGSQEVFQKALTDLKIYLYLEENDLEYDENKKPDWSKWYAGYDNTPPNPGYIDLKVLRGNQWNPTGEEIIRRYLFPSSSKEKITIISIINNDDVENIINRLALNVPEATELIESWTPKSKNGFLRLQLAGDDFCHDKYPTVLSRQVLAQALIVNERVIDEAYYRITGIEGIKSGIDAESLIDARDDIVHKDVKPVMPKEPFTPVITSLSLSYIAKASYTKPAETETKKQDISLFHLYPFDRFLLLPSETPFSLLPSFPNEGSSTIGLRDEGTLYIGIKDLNSPVALPLLFQVAEETADTDINRDDIDIDWYFLKDNEWKKFEDYQVVSDTTNGLINSGIVKLAIPEEISREKTTILDPELYWIKLSVPKLTGAVCDIIKIHSQAALVTFLDRDNDPNRLASPLTAGTIAKLATPQPEIKKVEQPYESFDGKVKEQANQFYTRISEHLRHKGRAVSIFDYERLVLEKFPEIYKVRCINHAQVDKDAELRELVPGAVTLVVIPDLSQRSTTKDLEPKVNVNLLQKVAEYLSQLSSSWVEIQVVNPEYERIQVKFHIQFKEAFQSNFDYYRRELEQSVISFLAPWTSSEGREISFGGKIYRSSILNFVEEQSYVDYVIDFEMYLGKVNGTNLNEITASSARSILTSQQTHVIEQKVNKPSVPTINSGKLGYSPLEQLKLMGEREEGSQ